MKKKMSYFCVKMTIAVQIEGRTTGMQSFEERYVLYKARSEAEAIARAEAAAPAYSEPYRNSDGVLVRWRIERIDDSYEVVLDEPRSLDGAEVFSILKTRKLTPERAWTRAV